MSRDIWHIYAADVKPGPLAPGVRAIRYGQALGGRPCADAYLHDPPRDAYDREWVDRVLSLRLSPGAHIHQLYTEPEYSHRGCEVTTDE